MKVLVTEATRNASNAIVQALHGAGHQVFGSDCRRLPFDAHSRYTSAYFPSAALADEGYTAAMLDILSRTGADVLVPGNQVEPFSRDRARFAEVTHLLVPDYPAWQATYYNDRTLESCRRLGIDCPMLFSVDEARDYLREDAVHKLMLKPRADIGGGQGLQLVHDQKQLGRLVETLDLEQYFLQEFIPGPVSSMRSVAVLYDSNSELQLFFTSHKLRQWPQDGGICALGSSTWEPELVELVQPFFAHWKWQGVAEVEFKIDARDGSAKLIEINPRFWGHTHYAVQAGVNFPAALCRLAVGKAVSQPRYRVGFNYINWSPYLRCLSADLLHGADKTAALHAFLANLKAPRAHNIDWRDWRFTLAKAAFELGDSLGR